MSLYCHTVAVCMITYNHSEFIAQAIDSIIMQNTNFSYHLYIGEDCSTDNTREICLEYKKKYPDKITLLFPDKNLGIQTNLINTLESCKGKYIAFCEGDDYWTDPYKLQKQVDFLESHPECSMVYHCVKCLFVSTNEFKNDFFNKSDNIKFYDVKDLSEGNFIHTPSVMICHKSLNLDDLVLDLPVSDYVMWLSCAMYGRIGYIPDIMAVYRVWQGSVWEMRPQSYKSEILIRLILSLWDKYKENKDVLDGFFYQLHFNYRIVLEQSQDICKDKNLDKITKKLIYSVLPFRDWWFNYANHVKFKRSYKLKYYFYLVSRSQLPSYRLFVKAIL